MPEGDTVWRSARRLDEALTGQTLTRGDLRVPHLATTDLSGARVVATLARGKHLLTRLDLAGTAMTLHTHLKMEGAWRVLRTGARWPRPAHQARVVLDTGTTQAVGFSLGIVELLETADEHTVVGHLGPDLLGADWDPAEAVHRLADDPDRTLHSALLDQRNLAGLGNMYVAELAFLRGHHPETPVRDVDLPRLVTLAHIVLDQNRHRAVQATTGSTRRGDNVWVYRREGRPCRRCGTTIEVGMLGDPGRERATYWCPRCQPA